jgi:hypothetical protein
MGVALVAAFIGHLQRVITVRCGAIVSSRIPQFTTALTESIRCDIPISPLVPASTGGRSSSSGLPNCPQASATANLASQ